MEKKKQNPEDASDSKPEKASAKQDYVAPGVPIVRSSTPRPLPLPKVAKTELPFAPSTADFPTQAPDAPPLPEEPLGTEQTETRQAVLSPPRPEADATDAGLVAKPLASEFIWLFEYALDMDPVLLNRPERLDGAAFAYGPAMLKGYRLVFDGLDTRTGQVIASLTEARHQPAIETWGILYRVPRRLTQNENGVAALLDTVHLAQAFVPIEVQVREPYRQREITCLTYIASEATRRQVEQLAQRDRLPQAAYCKRLLQIARRQKLPMSYIRSLEELLPPATTTQPATPTEQDTEPLPTVATRRNIRKYVREGIETYSPGLYGGLADGAANQPGEYRETRVAPYPASVERWLIAFALYICLLLLGALTLAVFQGLAFWPDVFNNAFIPLGIPWYVLLYGLLGGCVSCVITLNRPAASYPPSFVVLTWFVRPFLGAILGAFAYLLLNSGAVLISTQPAQHFALNAAIGALAGLCESKILLKKNLSREF